MPPRFFVERPLQVGESFDLPAGAARHAQVLRLQPGGAITLFDGRGGEWAASVLRMGRSEVGVQLGAHAAVDRELALPVTLALGMPANERMDTVIEKATELGAAVVQPLVCERSVLRLSGERAQKKVAHWQAVAQSACEQSGRTRVLRVEPVRTLAEWLRTLADRDDDVDGADDVDGGFAGNDDGTRTGTRTGTHSTARVRAARWMLGFDPGARRLGEVAAPPAGIVALSGPEGGLAPAEEALARAAGFATVSLGPRVLRADTAPLALLAHLSVLAS